MPNSLSNFFSTVPRKYIYLLLGATTLLIIFVLVFAFTSSSVQEQESTEIFQGEGTISEGQSFSETENTFPPTAAPTIVPTYTTPEAAAVSFYRWYVNHPAPLSSGAYSTRQDITEEYKKVMTRYVNRGINPNRDPIFNCASQPPPKEIYVLPAEFNYNQTQAFVIMQDTSGRKLYQLKLNKTGEIWLLRDVWCAPTS